MDKPAQGARISKIFGPDCWIEGAALSQLEKMAQLPGMREVFAMPDLHPGAGVPNGAVFVSDRPYPHLVGSDIGCGVALWALDISAKRLRPEKLAKKLNFEAGLGAPAALAALGPAPEGASWPDSFGTIGGGNHFLEISRALEVSPEAQALGLREGSCALLVHTGSRGLGKSVQSAFWDAHGAKAAQKDDPAALAWIQGQSACLAFARANRQALAERFFEQTGIEGSLVSDCFHNFAELLPDGLWLTRKGASPSGVGPVALPASRGALSALFAPSPQADFQTCGCSLSHGAGRKWARSECKGRLEGRLSRSDMLRTRLGGHVICEDKELLWEEAPEAYKNLDPALEFLESKGLGKSLARLSPLLTYKTKTP